MNKEPLLHQIVDKNQWLKKKKKCKPMVTMEMEHKRLAHLKIRTKIQSRVGEIKNPRLSKYMKYLICKPFQKRAGEILREMSITLKEKKLS